MISLKSAHGTYLSFVRSEGLLKADRTEVKEWEDLKVIQDPSDITHGWIEDRDRNNLYEDWGIARIGKIDDQAKKYLGLWIRDGLLSIQVANTGLWLRVGDAEEGYAISFVESVGEWETFTIEEVAVVIPTYRMLQGRTRFDGARIIDDNGPVLPAFVHYGDGRALFSVDESTTRRNFRLFADNAFQGFLSWSLLNDEGESNPWHIPPYYYLGPNHQADFWEKTKAYFLLGKEYGLKWMCPTGGLDALGDLEGAKRFYEKFCDVIEDVGVEWAVWETTNELFAASSSKWHRADWIEELTDIPRRRFGNDLIIMTSSLGGVEDIEPLAEYNRKTQIMSHHQFRGLSVGNKADHPWTMGYETLDKIRRANGNSKLTAIWGTEPCGGYSDIDAYYGANSSDRSKIRAYVSVMDNGYRGDNQLDDESIGYIALKNYVGRSAFNFFCSAGVKFFDGANFEDYPGFRNVARMAQALPQDMWGWEWIGHGGDNRPWSHMRVLRAPIDGRVDGLWSNDGRGFQALGGTNNIHDRNWSYEVLKSFKGWIIHPGTLEKNEIQRNKGEELNLSFKWGRGLYTEAI